MSGFEIDYKFCPYCAKPLSIRIEEEKNGKYCQKCNWTHYPTEHVAPAGIMLSGPEILLVRRNKEPRKGKWQLPSGFKEWGETTLQALERELREELDISLRRSLWFDEKRSSEDPRNPGVLVVFYKVKWRGKPINNESRENMAIQWFNLNNRLPPIAWQTHKKILKRLKKMGQNQ